MQPIELTILHHTDQTATLKNVGIDYPLSECDERPVTFYNINAISPYIEDKKQYTSIHSNGSEYICPYPYEIVREAIQMGGKLFRTKPKANV